MEQYEGPYGGTSYILEDINELTKIPKNAQQLATQKILSLFKQNITDQIKFLSSEHPTVPEYIKTFLNNLGKAKECSLKIHMTEYASEMAYLRYHFGEDWNIGLSYDYIKKESMPQFIPKSLQNVYDITGEINLNGYGAAGGLLYPPNPSPVIGKWSGDEFIETEYSNGYTAFYQCFSSDYLLYNKQNKDANTVWYIHDDSSMTGEYKDMDKTLADMFNAFTANKEFNAYGESD